MPDHKHDQLRINPLRLRSGFGSRVRPYCTGIARMPNGCVKKKRIKKIAFEIKEERTNKAGY